MLTALALTAAPATAKDKKGHKGEDDDFADEDDSELFTVMARLAEEGDEDAADDEEWFDEEDADCTAELVPGAVVHEAELEAGVFWTVELVAG
jgi:hypothetical protein